MANGYVAMGTIGMKRSRSGSSTSAVIIAVMTVVPVLLSFPYHGSVEAFTFTSTQPYLSHRTSTPSRVPYVFRAAVDDRRDLKLNNDSDDWRAFRAKLVQNGLPTTNTNTNMNTNANTNTNVNGGEDDATTSSTTSLRYTYASTPLVEVGTVLVSVPTTDLCQAIEQQYWHRSVVLITHVSRDRVRGDEETEVPVDQLSHGRGRGRCSYKGVFLNRPTDFRLGFDGTRTDGDPNSSDEYEPWRIGRGGDLAGLRWTNSHYSLEDDPEHHTELTCLHALDFNAQTSGGDDRLRRASTPLVGSLCQISFEDAQDLVRSSSSSSGKWNYTHTYTAADFFVYGGFCSWRPGQLEMEMGEERGEWICLSVDAETILDELRTQQLAATAASLTMDPEEKKEDGSSDNDSASEAIQSRVERRPHQLLKAGTNMWKSFLQRIDKSESRATERIPVPQLDFYDRMLRVWAEENLTSVRNGKNSHDHDGRKTTPSCAIGPGTLVRAKAIVPNDSLLFDQEFIQSVVLVLEESFDATVGLILNHPLPAALNVGVVSFNDPSSEEGSPPLPLRYGGPVRSQDWMDGTIVNDLELVEVQHEEEDEEEENYEGFLDYMEQLQEGGSEIENQGGIYEFEDNDEYYDDDDDDDDDDFIWIHRDELLGSRGLDRGGGSPLGESGFFRISETDALSALQSKLISPRDIFIFSGVCIWEKAPDLGIRQGGLREHIDGQVELFDIVQDYDVHGTDTTTTRSRVHPTSTNNRVSCERVWNILERQQVLTKESFESNIALAKEAWLSTATSTTTQSESMNGKEENHPSPMLLPSSKTMDKEMDSQQQRVQLEDAALRAWVAVNLLCDPLGTLVALREEKRKR